MISSPPTTPKASRTLQLLLVFVPAIFLVITAMDSIWSSSSDMAHHYALAARLAEFWTMPAARDLSLGEMNIYPRTSHLLAAIAGNFFDSPLIGMQLMSLFSIIAIWASLLFVVLALPKTTGIKTATYLALLIVLNYFVFDANLHGNEVVGNYFYAQLVAQAFVTVGLAITLSIERNGIKPVIRYALLIALIYFVAGIHLLPAAEMLFFLLALIAIDTFIEIKNTKKFAKKLDIKASIIALGFMVGGTLLLIRHPAYAAMKEIGQNNGSLFTKYLNNITSISLYCLVIAAVSATLVFQWLKRKEDAQYLLTLKYIGLYGLAVSGLCLVQILSLKMGQGSEYAVKKHVFALNTVFFIELALLPLLVQIIRKPNSLPLHPNNSSIVYSYLLLPALTVLAFLGVTPRSKAIDTSDIVNLEHRLQSHRDALLSGAPGAYVYVAPAPNLNPMIAYMMTIGVFKSPRNEPSTSILQGMTIYPSTGTVLALSTSPIGQITSCHQALTVPGFSAFDARCLGRKMQPDRSIIGLSTMDETPPCSLEGFSVPEEGGRWTESKQASIKCPMPDLAGKTPSKILIDTSAFLDHVSFQRASFSVNGGTPVEYRYDAQNPKKLIELPIPDQGKKTAEIHLSLPDAVSPKQLGLSEDIRLLGLTVKSFDFR